MRVAPLAAALLLSISALGASIAQAQSTAEDRAVELAHRGREYFNQGRFQDALAAFEQAETLASSPVLGLYIARSHRNLGHLVAARDHYHKVIDTDLPKTAPEPFRAAKSDAEKDLDALLPRIPRVTIELVPASPGATLAVDGAEVSATGPYDLDPGAHEVVVREGDAERARKRFVLQEGDKAANVRVDLAPSGRADDVSEPAPASSEGSLVPGFVVLGAGAAGLLVGAITGGLAVSAESDLAESCPGSVCPPEKRGDLDSANTLALTSTVSFIVGGAIAATGVVLLIVRPGGGDEPTSPAVSLRLSPGWLGVSGTF